MLLGFFSWRLRPDRSFLLFAFLMPLVNSLPALLRVDLPFNYSAPLLFYLSGLVLGSLSQGRRPSFNFNWSGPYLFFLVLLFGGTLLTLARWSNIGLSPLALFRNTPINAAGDRFSYAVIFPVITFFLAAAAPFAAALAKASGLKLDKIWRAASLGFLFSLLTGLFQLFFDPGFLSQSWWVTEHGHVNAGFSDFNAFGFCAGFLFLHHALALSYPGARAGAQSHRQRAEQYLFLLAALGGVFLSGSRTAFFFVLVAGAGLFFSPRFSRRQKTLLAFAALLLVLLAGGTVRDRLTGNLRLISKSWKEAGLLKTLDRFSNGRVTMIENSAAMVAAHPLAGVGSGNFYFHLKQDKINDPDPLLDLPLNQYLLPATELGLLGLTVFLFFLRQAWPKTRNRGQKVLLAAILSVFLFHNPLWFPECAVFFWLLLADSPATTKKKGGFKPFTLLVVLLLFALGASLSWKTLHPANWAGRAGVTYDYGFWYQEKDSRDRTFNWSKGRGAGLLLRLDDQGRFAGLSIRAAAPFSYLPAGRQQVKLYWRGRLWRVLEFVAPGEYSVDLQAEPGAEGFFEIRVKPVFNLNKMGMGPETRNLGVQVFSGEIK